MRAAITLTNKTATITRATPKTLKAISDHLSFYPKGYRFAPAFKVGGWDGRIKFVKKGRIPAGLFRAERKAMNEAGIYFKVIHKRIKVKSAGAGVESDPRTKAPQYAYQGECVDAMIDAVGAGGGIVLMLTGGGKTAIAARFAAKLNKAYSVLFIVDQVNLLYQSQKEIADWLKVPVGVVGDSEFKPERVTVATIQTLHAHSKLPTRAKMKKRTVAEKKLAVKHVNDFRFWMAKCNVMIIDELHTQLARRNFKVIELAHPLATYGLTGTLKLSQKPIRLKAYATVGPVIFEFPMQEGVKAGVVTKATVLQLLFNRRKERQGDGYAEEYPYQTYRHPVKRAAVGAITNYLVCDRGKYVLLLCDRIAHLWDLSDTFNELPHGVACGAVKTGRRLKYQADFEAGKIRLMIANKVFTKGVNLKRVDVEIDLAEYRDTDAAQQKLGRGVRLHIAKDHLLYIDFGTMHQLGDSLKANKNNGSRFARAAKARASAFKRQGIKVIKVNVTSADEALQAVIKLLNKVDKASDSSRTEGNQRREHASKRQVVA